MIGGKFVPLTIMDNEDTDLDSMITTFNTAVTERAGEVLGKHRQKKKHWVTPEILDLCDKRKELRKKRFELEGSEKYKEVNNSIKRCMKTYFERFRPMQNNAARLILKVSKTYHITPHLRTLHWLPFDARIKYKLCSLCFGATTFAGAVYFSELFKIYTPSRQLQSSAICQH